MNAKYYDGTNLLNMKDIDNKAPEIYIVTTNRTGGKTTYFNRLCINRFLKQGKKFCLLYRYQYELEQVSEKFFKDIKALFFNDYMMEEKTLGKSGFKELFIGKDWEHMASCGYAISLNASDNVKKYSHFFNDTELILFDEFQTESNRYISDEADLPPQAASAPAALIIPTAFKKERREMAFFIISSPYLSSYRRSFIPDRSCWPYYRKLLSFCPSVAYTIFRKFSCLFRTNIWDTSQILATFTSFAASCSRIFNQMKQQPAYVLTLESADDTVYELYTAGKAMKQSLEAAASGYETLMTSPRADMGDSISKAFQNVDDILKELQIETSESNRRAVRILAYNSTEITEDNIKQIKSVDEQVQRAFSDMTPAVTIEMIKRGISPLDMSMRDISDIARQIKSENPDERDEKFSEFLWKLEKKNEISEEERDSYIGIYRLISQVEQSDGAVIGSLVNQGADITMKNLLTAVRTRGKSTMDYKVDDTFAGVEGVSKGARIDEQIESAYQANCLRDVLDTLSPEKMEFVQDDGWLEMTPEQLRQAVYEADEDNTLSEQYATEQLRQFNQAVSVPESVYAFLEKYDVKTTAVNLMAASRLMKNPSEAVRNLWERGDSATARALLDETLRRFSESVKNPKELAQAQETLADTAEHVMDSMIIEDRHTGSIDLRQMKLLCSQLRIASNMSRQENYIVPIETADGVTGMKLRIVRGEDKRGLVDIFLEDKKCGRVAAYFEAKENSVSAMIVTDDEQTKKLFEDNITMFEAGISDGEQRVRIDVALEHDISAKESKMSDMKSNTESDNETKKQLDGSESVQTTRLYHIAEQFIVNVQRVIAQDSL